MWLLGTFCLFSKAREAVNQILISIFFNDRAEFLLNYHCNEENTCEGPDDFKCNFLPVIEITTKNKKQRYVTNKLIK